MNKGLCGLHVLHNYFKVGSAATSWQIDHFLSSLYTLFEDCPAKLQDYYGISKTDKTLKFIKRKWLDSRELEPEPCFPWSWSRSSKFSHAPELLLFFNILLNLFFKNYINIQYFNCNRKNE